MNAAVSAAARPSGRFGPGARYHGLQLAVVVIAAYGAAAAIGLPERYWAVLSALIVLRPTTGATLEAGGQRVAGTLAGALCGLLGVALQQAGLPGLPATLVTVGGLAYASAAAAGWRSAPVAALIILAAGSLPGHSVVQAALLRVGQIAIGVGVALLVALLSSRLRAGQRLHAGCAALLRRLATALAELRRPGEAEAEGAAAALRQGLGRLAELAGHADRKVRWRRAPAKPGERHHRRIAGLTGRIAQDVTTLRRVLYLLQDAEAEPLARQVAEAVAAALEEMATGLEQPSGGPPPDIATLAELPERLAGLRSGALLSAPLRLLTEDMQLLRRLVWNTGGALPRRREG